LDNTDFEEISVNCEISSYAPALKSDQVLRGTPCSTPLIHIQDGQCACQLTQGSEGIIYGSAQGGGIWVPDCQTRRRKAQYFHPRSIAFTSQCREVHQRTASGP
jgi:hypothetical protein